MHVLQSVVFLIAVIAVTFAYPASDKASESSTKPEGHVPLDTEIDFVPLEERRAGPFPPNGVVDVDANAGGFFGNPFYDNPFPSLFDNFNALMYRMRQQLNQLLGRVPERAGDSPFPELHIPNVGNIDLGKGNTTSVTKIVDGHKVTINETEYKQEGDNGGSYFKVRVIDVHPNSEEPTDKPVDVPDRETVELTDSNEIAKVKDNEALRRGDIEMFNEADSVDGHHSAHVRSNHWGRPLDSIDDNSINSELVPPPDLSNDIYVNQLLMDRGAPTNPDAEIFDVSNGPRKAAPLNYLPPRRDEHDFARFAFQPAYTDNMQFVPHPIIHPIGNPIPNFLPPNDFYVRPPNFPVFQSHLPTNQMHMPSTPNMQQPSGHFDADLKRTTKSIGKNDVPASTETEGSSPSTS